MTAVADPQGQILTSRELRVAGIVQGVGFRPFVYGLASGLDLAGWVANDAAGVVICVEGPAESLVEFEQRLTCDAPPLARVDRIESHDVEPRGLSDFSIVDSQDTEAGRTYVSPDVAVCDDCLRELFDPGNRRYRYPFINCTNCGPRFTITERLPYDRPNTTMRSFVLCDRCRQEYDDPADRRFHAQPVACADCGPRLRFEPGFVRDDDAIVSAQAALAGGAIVAVKGIGGYHLACDASNEEAVVRLRRRKGRPTKPLAVMVPDHGTAVRFADLAIDSARLLADPRRPIVLVPRRPGAGLAPSVAPGSPDVGLLLPYSPLHHLLFAEVPGKTQEAPQALVMTSGNLSEEPICFDDSEAKRRLARIADAWLLHDRPIHLPCDDSVAVVSAGREVPIRRSRGYAPLPVGLPFEVPAVLAVGGELKNTFCLAQGPDAWMSQHLGDMGGAETIAAFERSVAQFTDMYGIEPELLAADCHPGYVTRSWAERVAHDRLVLVQHHHAHVAALMAEAGLRPGERIIGVAFDGTGYGLDGAIWGGEILVAGYDGFRRVAHLRYVTMPSGDRAARAPYLSALAHLRAAAVAWEPDLPPAETLSPAERAILEAQLEGRLPGTRTSSVGRLFDAAASLIGVRQVNGHEAQAAMEFEALATTHMSSARDYHFALRSGPSGREIDATPVVAAMAQDVRGGAEPGSLAAGFHLALAEAICDLATFSGHEHGIGRVGLTGGVFQNRLLLALARDRLAKRGFEVLTHLAVPPNDGGLALGQAVVAGYRAVAGDES